MIGFCGRGTWKRLTLFCLGKSGAINSPRSYCLSTVWAGSWPQVLETGRSSVRAFCPVVTCCYPGGDIVVSHSLLWRPWVTVRISESLCGISFLNIILNAIFYRSLKYLGLSRYLWLDRLYYYKLLVLRQMHWNFAGKSRPHGDAQINGDGLN